MKWEYQIDLNRNVIVKKTVGILTVGDEIDQVETILADPKYRKGLGIFCDLTEANAVWTLQDLDRFRAYVGRIKNITGQNKWAILISPDKDNSSARIFAALHDALEDTIEIRIFQDQAAAMQWLQKPVLNYQ